MYVHFLSSLPVEANSPVNYTLDPNAVLQGNYNHECNQLLLTKEYEEKVGIRLLWGRFWKKEGDTIKKNGTTSQDKLLELDHQ